MHHSMWRVHWFRLILRVVESSVLDYQLVSLLTTVCRHCDNVRSSRFTGADNCFVIVHKPQHDLVLLGRASVIGDAWSLRNICRLILAALIGL